MCAHQVSYWVLSEQIPLPRAWLKATSLCIASKIDSCLSRRAAAEFLATRQKDYTAYLVIYRKEKHQKTKEPINHCCSRQSQFIWGGYIPKSYCRKKVWHTTNQHATVGYPQTNRQLLPTCLFNTESKAAPALGNGSKETIPVARNSNDAWKLPWMGIHRSRSCSTYFGSTPNQGVIQALGLYWRHQTNQWMSNMLLQRDHWHLKHPPWKRNSSKVCPNKRLVPKVTRPLLGSKNHLNLVKWEFILFIQAILPKQL